MKKRIKHKPNPKQTVLNSIETIRMFIRGTPYDTYIQKELEQIKKIMINKKESDTTKRLRESGKGEG